jgi:hypothetical protein
MSENNKPELIVTDAELLPAELFDFEFITFSLGLVPICNGDAAISLGNIASLAKAEEGDGWLLTLINDEEYQLGDDDLMALERLLKDRKANRKNVIKEEIEAQLKANAEMRCLARSNRRSRKQERLSLMADKIFLFVGIAVVCLIIVWWLIEGLYKDWIE